MSEKRKKKKKSILDKFHPLLSLWLLLKKMINREETFWNLEAEEGGDWGGPQEGEKKLAKGKREVGSRW